MRLGFGSALLDTGARVLIPFILLFGLYVLFHGHYSPGGGFQAGVILATAWILLRLVRGNDPGWGPESRGALVMAISGVGIYLGIGFGALAFGGAFLDYGAFPLPLPPAATRAAATFVVESGVGLAVAGVMLIIYEALIAPES